MAEIKLPKRTLLDRAIGVVSPQAEFNRYQARIKTEMLGSYVGASGSRRSFSNWFATDKSADADLIPSLPIMRARSNDMVRNNPLAAGIIKGNRTNIVGRGLRFQSNIDAEFLGLDEIQKRQKQKEIERIFSAFAESKDCDIKRSQTFYQQQGLALTSCFTNGDSFGVLANKPVAGFPFKTRVQLIEAHRVCNEKDKQNSARLVMGVHLDDSGAPTAYDILLSHPGALTREAKKWKTVQAYGAYGRRNVIHLFEKTRIGQTRGEPYLAPVIEPLKQLSKYTENEIMAAVVSSLFTVFVQNGEAGAAGLLESSRMDRTGSGGSKVTRDYELGNGAIINGEPGDKIEVINPGRPNVAFDPFVQAILRQIGVALELPFEVLIKHFTASYSAARSSLLEAWKFYKNRRNWLVVDFCQPVFEAVIMEAVADGRLYAPGFFSDPMIRRAYLRGSWHGDGPGAIDPYKEAQGIEKRIDIGLSTLDEEIAAYDGGDFESKHSQRSKEHTARSKAGLIKDSPASVDPVEQNTIEE